MVQDTAPTESHGLDNLPIFEPSRQPDNPLGRITINSVNYPLAQYGVVEEGRTLRYEMTEGFEDGMNSILPVNRHGAFTTRGFRDQINFDVSQRPYITLGPAFAASITIATLDTNYPVYTFYASGGAVSWCYVLNKDRIYKVRLSDNTVQNTRQFASAIMGRPLLTDGSWSIPMGEAVNAQLLTTITGDTSNDTYSSLGADYLHFAGPINDGGTNKFVRAYDTFEIDLVTTTAAAKASPGYEVGDTSHQITDLLVWQNEFVAFKPDNVYRGDINGNIIGQDPFVNNDPDLLTKYNYLGAQSAIWGGAYLWAHRTLRRFLGDSVAPVGPDSDPRLQTSQDDGWQSIAIAGNWIYATSSNRVYYGVLDENAIPTWYGALLVLGVGEVRINITDGPTLWAVAGTTLYRIELAEDGSPRTSLTVNRGAVSTAYQIMGPELHMGEMIGEDLSTKRKQGRAMGVIFRTPGANYTASLRVLRDGASDGNQEVVGSANFTATATPEKIEQSWTPGTNDLFYFVQPEILLNTEADFAPATNAPVIRCFWIEAVTPALYRAVIPLTPEALRGFDVSARGALENLQDLKNGAEQTILVQQSGGNESYSAQITGVRENYRAEYGGTSYELEVYFERFDWRGAA